MATMAEHRITAEGIRPGDVISSDMIARVRSGSELGSAPVVDWTETFEVRRVTTTRDAYEDVTSVLLITPDGFYGFDAEPTTRVVVRRYVD